MSDPYYKQEALADFANIGEQSPEPAASFSIIMEKPTERGMALIALAVAAGTPLRVLH